MNHPICIKWIAAALVLLSTVTIANPARADDTAPVPGDFIYWEGPCENLTPLGGFNAIYNSMPYAWTATFTVHSYSLPFFRWVKAGVIKYLDRSAWIADGTSDKTTGRIYKVPVPPLSVVQIFYCADQSHGHAMMQGSVELIPVDQHDGGPGPQKSISFSGIDGAPKFDVHEAGPYIRYNESDGVSNPVKENGSIYLCADAQCKEPSKIEWRY